MIMEIIARKGTRWKLLSAVYRFRITVTGGLILRSTFYREIRGWGRARKGH